MSETFENSTPRGTIESVSEGAGGADLRNARRRRRRAASPEALNTDRLPPYSMEAEQGVIGCMLLSPQDCVPQMIEMIGERPEPLYDLRHQTIYSVMVEMYDAQEAIDVITVQQKLKDRQLLEQIGGIPYLNALQDAVPSAANITYYADHVIEKYRLREMIRVGTDLVGKVYRWEGDVEQLQDETESDILGLRGRESGTGFKRIGEFVQPVMADIERSIENHGTLTGLGTGFPDFDRMTRGLQPGELTIIAARPSMGKTSLAMNIAEHVAINLGLPVGVFSAEMTSKALTYRMVCCNARVNARCITDGFMRESDYPRLTAASGRINGAPLFIDDTAGMSIMQTRSRARRLHQQHGIRLFVADYLQLFSGTNRRSQQTREQEVSEVSAGFKALAKELNVPVIALAQLNRAIEKEKRKPRLSDLRESGAIEQDADLVGFLYKPGDDEEEGNQTMDEIDGLPVNLLIAKQRNGPTGDVNLIFLRSYTRFESAARVSEEDVPRE